MLRINVMAGSEAAKKYYTAALARADYYVSGSEIVGNWRGKGAMTLGLHDRPVDQSTFGLMADNWHPQRPGEPLTARTHTNRRVGYDFNFHSPKGLSVMHALTGDERIQSVFLQAVRATMDEIEQSMQVRVRVDGETDADRVTGNWVYGEFLHLTARPTATDGAPDPHMHCHCTAMNASYDEIEQKWKAGQFGSIKRDANYYEAAFHVRLARAVQALGYRIEKRGKYWDLADLRPEVIQRFSKRTDVIEKKAELLGVTDAKAKDRLAAQTRAKKRTGLSSDDLKTAWIAQLSNAELQAIKSVYQQATEGQRIVSKARAAQMSAHDAMEYAIAHIYERQSVASDRQLVEVALRHGLDRGIELADVWAEFRARDASKEIFSRQVGDQRLCTTREAYEESSRCIDYAREGMGQCRALAPLWRIHRPQLLAPTAADQRAAIQHVLASTDRVIAVQGRAGTGKTFASQEIAAALAAAGHRMHALAPTSKAVDVLREEGFRNADTVSQLLINPALQEQVADGVLLVDEAGLLSARQLDKLFQVAGAQNCRVLLQYDLSQHRSVERGSPVRDLERYAGLSAAQIYVIRRQKREDYRAAMNDLSHFEYEAAFERLLTMEAFAEISDADQRQRRLASDYLAATRQADKTALVVSPTHREGDAVTRAIRLALRGSRRLADNEHETLTLRRLGLTAAQRGEAINYEVGQIVQFTQNVKGYERGARLIVKEICADGRVLAQRSESDEKAYVLPLHEKAAFDVYEAKAIGLSVGDSIRITQNGYVPVVSAREVSSEGTAVDDTGVAKRSARAKGKPALRRLINGAMYKVVRFMKNGDPVLSNGWVLPRSYGHLAYGYCTTSHASQGTTVDTVLISQSSASFRASSCEQFYVSCTRGKTGIKIYTDSVDELFQAVCRSHQQTSAADLMHSQPGSSESLSDRMKIRQKKRTFALQREASHRTVVTALQRQSHLKIEVQQGTAVIATENETYLKTGTVEGAPVIVTRDETKLRISAIYQGETICAPFVSKATHRPRSATEHPTKTSKPTATEDTATALRGQKTTFVPMFSPETQDNTNQISI